MLFTGDIVINEEGTQDIIEQEVKEIFKETNIVCGNLEAPFIDEQLVCEKKIGPVVSQRGNRAERIVELGFDIFTLANNHIMDYGIKGLEATKKKLKNHILLGAGVDFCEAYSTKIVEQGNIRMGIISVAENGFGCCTNEREGGYAHIFHSKTIRNIIELKKQVDFVILVSHAGAEMVEVPLPEWREKYKLLIDLGVDIIVGHHPHVVQGYEEYNNGLIVYSLGNFCFDGRNKNKQWFEGAMLRIVFNNKQHFTYNLIGTIYENGIVKLDKSDSFNKKMDKLCELLYQDYEENINDICNRLYREVYVKYYKYMAYKIPDASIKAIISGIIKRILSKEDGIDSYWLYHNSAIETHRYICNRATKNYIIRGEKNFYDKFKEYLKKK